MKLKVLIEYPHCVLSITFQVYEKVPYLQCVAKVCDILENEALNESEMDAEIEAIMCTIAGYYSLQCSNAGIEIQFRTSTICRKTLVNV